MNKKNTIASYGLWESPIAAEAICAAVKRFGDLVVDGETIYWSEGRPQEGGRYVICCQTSTGEIETVLPAGFNVRTRVHEYGGAAFTVHQGIIYFINFDDQGLYVFSIGNPPQKLNTPEGCRFAELNMTPHGMVAVGEQHHEADPHQVENFLALIHPETGEMKIIASGSDFYSSPALTPDYQKIAWIQWNQPNMPWDNTELWVADFSEAGLSNLHQIDKNFSEQAFFQPQWNDKNELVVSSDKSNWWNLYQVEGEQLSEKPLFAVNSEIGEPLWGLGASCWRFFEAGIVASYAEQGIGKLFFYEQNKVKSIGDLPYTTFSALNRIGNELTCFAGASDRPTALIRFNPETLKYTILTQVSDLEYDSGYLSQPEHITFPSKDGRQAHAFFYAPRNRDFQAPEGEKPPLIVLSHGGPTGNCGSNFDLGKQYWLSRGYAIVDVNYGGSTGYGRAYRDSLKGQWGIIDVEDCEAAALYLAEAGYVDPQKLAIAGGSAGGYTTLAALTFTDTFHVGASHYGVGDLSALAEETHKFEAKYLDLLIAPYPEGKAIYDERAPIHHVEQLNCPVIFFQGEEDKVVPPEQAIKMYDALKEKGIETALFLFPGEQHGFRQAKNKVTVLIEQRRFFNTVFKLEK